MTQDEVSELRLFAAGHTGLDAHAASYVYAVAQTLFHYNGPHRLGRPRDLYLCCGTDLISF